MSAARETGTAAHEASRGAWVVARRRVRATIAIARVVALAMTTLTALACSSETTLETTVELTEGSEAGALSAEPRATRVTLSLRGPGGTRVLRDAGWPVAATTFETPSGGGSYAFDAVVRGATGEIVARGGTPFVAAGNLVGTRVPLLVGRVGSWSRPTAGLATPCPTPVATLVLGRFVFVASGADAWLYDLARLEPLPEATRLPRAARTIAPVGGTGLLVVDEAGADLIDLVSGEVTAISLPFAAQVAGAQAIVAEDGAAFVVGATRADGAPTRAVLRVLPDGNTSQFDLATPRAGAAAAWLPGVGLLVVGGAGTSGAELLSPGATAFASVTPEAPAVEGAALLPVRAGEALLVGGTAPGEAEGGAMLSPSAKRVRPNCPGGCAGVVDAGAWGGPVLRRARGFRQGDGRGLVVGIDASGLTTAATIDDDGATVTAREARPSGGVAGAASIDVGDGFVALIGGTAQGAADLAVRIFTPR